MSATPATESERITPDELTAQVVARFANTPDPRLREITQSLVRHVHAFIVDVGLTEAEWAFGIDFLTRTGKMCDEERQEFILLSDTTGVSMLVDAIACAREHQPTESTVLGPFYVPNSPARAFGASIVEEPSGDPLYVSGHIRDIGGAPIANGEIDVWQCADDGRYAVQAPEVAPANLRGIFRTRADGSYAFVGVRPTAYPIPDDGPVGEMLTATARHPWRPAHLHFTARAPGYHPVTTQVFDDESDYLESDAVFGVKPSLVRHLMPHAANEEGRPAGIDAGLAWFSLEFDLILEPIRH